MHRVNRIAGHLAAGPVVEDSHGLKREETASSFSPMGSKSPDDIVVRSRSLFATNALLAAATSQVHGHGYFPGSPSWWSLYLSLPSFRLLPGFGLVLRRVPATYTSASLVMCPPSHLVLSWEHQTKTKNKYKKVVSALRTAIGRARKGSFKDTKPDDLLAAVLQATMDQTGVSHQELGDITIGNVQMGGSYAGPARMAQFRAGIPETVPLYTINRQCSSGLQAVANVAQSIKAGTIDAGIGGGVESMSLGGGVKGGGSEMMETINLSALGDCELAMQATTPMGITSENVAERYGITRQQQDQMAVESNAKAVQAQKMNWFDGEIVPVKTVITDKEGEEQEITVSKDDGPRAGTSLATLAKLKPAFKPDGSTHAGNASQVSDGAAAVLLMRRSRADALGLKPLGAFRAYQVRGVQPDEMGIGPAVAIPAALESVGIGVDDVDIYEINEAFASQAVYCVNKLGIDMKKVNPVGGAIALGHPLGCTGARQIATLFNQLKRTDKKVGVVSMCIGTGMGAAGVFERE